MVKNGTIMKVYTKITLTTFKVSLISFIDFTFFIYHIQNYNQAHLDIR